MSNLTVVSNSGPLISLSAIGQLDLLRQLFQVVIIPEAVYREVVLLGQGRPGEAEVCHANWITRTYVRSVRIPNLLLDKLDAGESESIVLAFDLNADYVILDERLARRKASLLGIPVIGTLGILLMAKNDGYIQHVAPFLSELEQTSFRMSNDVKVRILAQAGE
jgi:predicted nucleic acid-binding protein